MKKKNNKTWWWIGLLFVAVLAIVTGYFLGLEKAQKDTRAPIVSLSDQGAQETLPEGEQIPKEEPPGPVEPEPAEKDKEPEALFKGCDEVNNEIAAFFDYLDEKGYFRGLGSNKNASSAFRELLETLSSHPPVPAGEGVDTRLITKNIFHFFRILDRKDLRLIRDIVKNEKDSMEVTMALFYVWLTGKGSNACPDLQGIRPGIDVLYNYAGFFLNTIGGRSYLFRRPTKFRLLVSFYSLLVLHEADKLGRNTYGIDIFSHIQPLADEIALYPDLYYKDQYLEKLHGLTTYYLNRR